MYSAQRTLCLVAALLCSAALVPTASAIDLVSQCEPDPRAWVDYCIYPQTYTVNAKKASVTGWTTQTICPVRDVCVDVFKPVVVVSDNTIPVNAVGVEVTPNGQQVVKDVCDLIGAACCTRCIEVGTLGATIVVACPDGATCEGIEPAIGHTARGPVAGYLAIIDGERVFIEGPAA